MHHPLEFSTLNPQPTHCTEHKIASVRGLSHATLHCKRLVFNRCTGKIKGFLLAIVIQYALATP